MRVASKTMAVALAAAVVAGSLATAPGASATPTVSISMHAGIGNRSPSEGWLPVTVRVTADEAVAGELQVGARSFAGHSNLVAVPATLAAGAVKEYRVALPAPARDAPVTAAFVTEEGVAGRIRLDSLPVEEEVLVGVLDGPVPPGLSGRLVEPLTSTVVAETLDPEWLSFDAETLGVVDYIVCDESVVAGLPAEYADVLLEWVALGGRLIITGDVAPARAPFPGLEFESIPPDVRSAPVGAGEIDLFAGSLADVGGADHLLRPAPHVTSRHDWAFADFNGLPPESSVLHALRDPDEVRFGWFVGFLLAYLLAVGPLNYIWLKRRGRRELMWLTVPLLSLAFSGVAYGLVRGSRGSVEVEAVAVAFATPAAGPGRLTVAITTAGGGARRLSFERSPVRYVPMNPWDSTGAAVVRQEGLGASVDVETAPFAVVGAQAPFDVQGFVDARLLPGPDGGEVEVVNKAPFALDDVAVTWGNNVSEIGRLPPGAAASAAISSPERRPPRHEIFPPGRGRGLRRSLVQQLGAMLGFPLTLDGPLVLGYAVGQRLPVTVDGRERDIRGRLLLASPVAVVAPARGTFVVAGATALVGVRGGGAAVRENGLYLEGFREATIVHRLPALDRGRIAGLTLQVRGRGPRPLVLGVFDWERGHWRQLGRRPFGPVFDLPPTVVSPRGEVYLRFTPAQEPFATISGVEMKAELR